jgi:hypothetical protein
MRGRGRPGAKGFKFEASWLEEKCAEVVEDAWKEAIQQPNTSTHNAIKVVAASLSNWSHNVLGDLEKRVKKLKRS